VFLVEAEAPRPVKTAGEHTQVSDGIIGLDKRCAKKREILSWFRWAVRLDIFRWYENELMPHQRDSRVRGELGIFDASCTRRELGEEKGLEVRALFSIGFQDY